MVCRECAVKNDVLDQWKESILSNFDDTCMECGEPSGTTEVDMDKYKLNKYQIMNNVKIKKDKIWKEL